MALYHLVNTLTNDAGDALVGYFVILRNSSTGVIAPLYADKDGDNPIIDVSGAANAAKTDSTGLYSLYVEDGAYDIEFYDKNDINLHLRSIPDVPMFGGATATAAAASATAAAGSASSAATSATTAGTAKDGAETAQTGAETAKTGAEDAAAEAVAAAAGVYIPLYTTEMKSAVGSGSLDALFDMDGPRTAYSGSPTIMTGITSLEGNAYNLEIYSAFIYSGADPRPVYTAGRGIYMSSGAGFETTDQMLQDTAEGFAFLYAVDLNTLSSTVGTEAGLPGSPTDGDMVKVNADRNIVSGLGNDTPIVLDGEFTAANLVNGYFRWNAYDTVWNRDAYLFKATSAGGQRFEASVNHLGQVSLFIYDGTNQVQLATRGRVVMESGLLVFAVRRIGNVFSMVVNGETVYGIGSSLPNVNALNQWYFNGDTRIGTVAQPVSKGLRHYVKGMAMASSLPDDAAFVRLYDTFARRHGAEPMQALKHAYGVPVMGQSWTQGAVAVSDTWTHGANNWNGEITPNNATYHQESDSITRETFGNVWAARHVNFPADIAPYEISVQVSGDQVAPNSHDGGGTGENFIKGWAAQVNQHTAGQAADWYLAWAGIGGASLATLANQNSVPLMSQLKTATLTGSDHYNKVLRQLVYQRDHAIARGRTFSVPLVLWQQGHTDLSNASYLTSFLAFYDRLCVDVQQITGQSNKPVLLAPQINWSYDGTENSGNCLAAAGSGSEGVIDQTFLDMEDNRSTSLPTGDTVPRPLYCIGPMYQITNFIHAYRAGHRWVGELFGVATTRILFDGESYGCLRPYAFTLGANYIDIDYRVRSGRALIVNATNENNIPSAVTNAGFEFTDTSAGGVTITGVAATDSNTIRISLSGAPAAGDIIRYTGKTLRTGNVADGAAVDGLYRDQDWTVSFTAGEPTFKTDTGELNDLRQWGVAFKKVLS